MSSNNATTWSVVSGGVSSARVSLHKAQHLVKRALELVEASDQREHLYQVAGDVIQSLPTMLASIGKDLDKTIYAISVLGKDSLKSQISASDREDVDVALESVGDPPDDPKKASALRVAKRALSVDSGMGSAEDDFNLVGRDEVLGLAESGAISNNPAIAVKSVKEMDGPTVSVSKARSQAKNAPPDVDDIMKMKHSDELGTLNRRLVERVARSYLRS